MSDQAITPAELRAAITDAIRDMDGDAALEATMRLCLWCPQHSSAPRVVGRGLDLQAVIRLASGGVHSGTPLEDVADAAQRALLDPDAVAAWVCAPLTADRTSDTTGA